MKKNLKTNKITLGTCYYPEHWPERLWKEDLKRMIDIGIEVIRIAEFAWSRFEPTEGNYTFEFFDRFLKAAEETGMKVIFCTPTATPPAWLTEKYPEVLNRTIDGVLFRHGGRRHYNYNSPIYRKFTEIIVEKIAQHYAPHPNIIGWQIDNEINCELNEFYSESDDMAFREFVREKYGTLETLNEAWGTAFWNQEYTDWSQVHVPQPVANRSMNPHRLLDYIRFVSASAREYVKLQSDILRKYIKKGDFITTNGMFGNLDNHKMTGESLDFYMYDSYPNFAYCLDEDIRPDGNLRDRNWSRNLSEVRSVSSNFGIMEQQSGANGWISRMEAPQPKPGQITLWTMQSIAHGADFISYFRWRTCTIGTEIYWHGILDYSNRENRRIAEIREISNKIKEMHEIAGTEYKAFFGVLKDHDNVWDSQLDKSHQRIEKVSSKGIFEASQLTHTPMDYVYIDECTTLEDLSKYPVLFYPHAVIMTEKRAALLKSYVEQGGTLILGCRTGYKDMTGKCVMLKLPGLLCDLSGADVVDYTFVGPEDDPVYIDWDGIKLEAAVYNDILEPLGDALVLGTYINNYYSGKAGLIGKKSGKGYIYYFGGTFTENTVRVFLQKTGALSPYRHILEIPESCELAVREKDDAEYLFVLNYSKGTQKIELKQQLFDLYEQKTVTGSVILNPYETKIYRREKI
ncbi:MAG: beta-galactosidase [Clostridiaceae bacterium]|jgi:beta-galactosidase|nr:beta-galactosidase [Clostridiaceae bacterium]